MITVSIYDHDNKTILFKESFENHSNIYVVIKDRMQYVLAKLFHKEDKKC